MIGSARITYTNENVCELVRRDLVDKFGNRELANYNLYLPGVVRGKADIRTWPNPEVTITSVEDQIKQMGVLPKPSVNRNPDSVQAVPDLYGAQLSSSFDYKTRKLLITGTVPFTKDEARMEQAHWYGITIEFPVGISFNEDDIIPFTMNGTPDVYVVTADDIAHNSITIICDAKYTTMNLTINWTNFNCPETIYTTNNATLESKAIDKIPAFPMEPKIEFTFPETTTDANVQVDVDLDMGKN